MLELVLDPAKEIIFLGLFYIRFFNWPLFICYETSVTVVIERFVVECYIYRSASERQKPTIYS
jgi:hypothetical protein